MKCVFYKQIGATGRSNRQDTLFLFECMESVYEYIPRSKYIASHLSHLCFSFFDLLRTSAPLMCHRPMHFRLRNICTWTVCKQWSIPFCHFSVFLPPPPAVHTSRGSTTSHLRGLHNRLDVSPGVTRRDRGTDCRPS